MTVATDEEMITENTVIAETTIVMIAATIVMIAATIVMITTTATITDNQYTSQSV